MRHSLEPEYRKYVKGYGFLSFAQNFEDKYGKSMISSKNVKKLMDGATKTSKDFVKSAAKKVIHKIILDPFIKMEFNKVNSLLGPTHDKV